MPKDSKLWQQAYESYNKFVPNGKYNKSSLVKAKPKLSKEPMLLLEEYRDILVQIKKLTVRRQQIRKEMRKHGSDPVKYTRSTYFERPILLYVLKLEHSCWYVGMSRNVDKRFKAHKKGGTIWTKEHTPLEIHEVRETGLTSDSEASKLEDELTFEYARRYGLDVVRGGGFCQRKPHWPKELLEPDLSWISQSLAQYFFYDYSYSMKSSLDRLTPKQKEDLALFYDSDAYNALQALCRYEIEGLGKDALDSPDHDQTRFYSGQANMAAKIPKIIRELYKSLDDNKKS